LPAIKARALAIVDRASLHGPLEEQIPKSADHADARKGAR
jgi:hypothetical protein